MKLQITFLTILMMGQISYSQCETYKLPLNDNVNITAMTEKIYQNEDLENGVKTFFLSVNSIPLEDDKSTVYLIVTYKSTMNNYWIIPNTIKITLPSGKILDLKAESKSSQTLNLFRRIPETSKSIECTFFLDYDTVLEIMGEQQIDKFIISDYTSNKSFNATPKFKGVLNEMLKCVLNL